MTYRQIELDLRLDYERGLKDNIATVTKFAGQKMAEDLQEEGRPPDGSQDKAGSLWRPCAAVRARIRKDAAS